MKIFAIILNVALLCFTVWLVCGSGFPSNNRKELLFFIVLITCPIVNLVALFRQGYLGLYFHRKALEEKRKIEALIEQD